MPRNADLPDSCYALDDMIFCGLCRCKTEDAHGVIGYRGTEICEFGDNDLSDHHSSHLNSKNAAEILGNPKFLTSRIIAAMGLTAIFDGVDRR